MAASISSVVTWLSINRVIDVAKRLTAASSIAGANVRQGGIPRSAKCEYMILDRRASTRSTLELDRCAPLFGTIVHWMMLL